MNFSIILAFLSFLAVGVIVRADDIPTAIDWREKGIITKVKDQGDCEGSFYFASLGILESYHYLITGETVDLSEQSVLDCSGGYNGGCAGGGIRNSLAFVRDKGVALEEDYHYEGKVGECRMSSTRNYFQAVGYEMLPKDEEVIRATVGTIGPVGVTFDGANLTSYSAGIYSDPECHENMQHSGIIVGYGTTSEGEDYWIVKMSYGPDWGEDGYIRMARNTDNQCDISDSAIYPIL